MSAILKALQNRKVEVELKSEVVELKARKIESIMKDSQKIDANLDKGEAKISKAWNTYKDAYSVFQDVLTTTGDKAGNLMVDLKELETAAKDLGVDTNSISGYSEAKKHVERMKELSGQFKFYPKP
jgi:hypothetical protein